MRVSWPAVVAALLSLSCGEENQHPPAADPCDPATMNCDKPPHAGGGPTNPGQGGADSGGDQTGTATGRVLQYTDDFFDDGVTYARPAKVSAMGTSSARVSADYEGASFELEDVRKTASNWFMVEPEQGSGMLPTITPVDTRLRLNDLGVGLTSERLIDGIFQQSLASTERSDGRAQIVMRVIDTKGSALEGVQATFTTELIAYRDGDTWLTEAVATDETGMIFFGNVAASVALTTVKIVLTGAVTAQVEVTIAAGATTVVSAVVAAP